MLLGNAVIGLATLVSFLAGIFASTGYERALRAVSQDRAVLLCLFIFLMGTLISTAKDIKDIEGDAACGVKNLFTVFGKKKAKIAVTALVFLVFNIPNLYVWNAYAYVLSLVAAALYFMFENIVIVYVAAMLCTGLVLEGVLSVKDKKCSSCSGRSGHKRRVVIEEIRKKRQEPQPVERKRIIRK
jgi:4-hydroxybenzoate polyprenyltransferase